jgi:hypothetical protein
MEITYSYIFGNHDARQFTIALDRETLRFLQQAQSSDLPWTRLGTHKYGVCTLHEDTHMFCPVVLNLAGIVEVFRDYFSYESVKVTVTMRERVSWKTTSLQEGLTSLLGLIIVTSGCPVMEHLKPMARFHLPFSTLEPSTGLSRCISWRRILEH